LQNARANFFIVPGLSGKKRGYQGKIRASRSLLSRATPDRVTQ
jgi:hypothetical protein